VEQKIYLDANELLELSFALANKIVESGFVPTHIVGIWRGGAPIGIAVQELLEYRGIHCDHIAFAPHLTAALVNRNAWSKSMRWDI